MKKTIAILAQLLVTLSAPAAPGAEHHVKVSLASIGGSGVSGFVELTQLPHGGANVHLIAHGLRPGTAYASFYYESADCTAPADLLGTFTAHPSGTGEVHGKIDDDLDEVGSMSVRLGPSYGTLLACARVH
jgi:hypothetical protein